MLDPISFAHGTKEQEEKEEKKSTELLLQLGNRHTHTRMFTALEKAKQSSQTADKPFHMIIGSLFKLHNAVIGDKSLDH